MGRRIPTPDVSPRALRRRRAKRGTGFVLYEGPSMLDGSNIVVIVTMTSTNEKTANMAQGWIFRDGANPFNAWKAGTDASVCGDCIHRGTTDPDTGERGERSCYPVFHAMASIWKKHERGGYPRMPRDQIADLFAGLKVRAGAYGDPAAAPAWLWEAVTSKAKRWTGYTHQWRLGFALQHLFMASVETAADVADARALGYRLFTVTPPGADLLSGHIWCPGGARGGYKTTCDRCGLCDGARDDDRRPDIQEEAHGAEDKIEKFLRAMERGVDA